MKTCKQILVLIVGGLYFLATTGVVVYKTNCVCLGQKNVSMYVAPESCVSDLNEHHSHDEHENDVSCCNNDCHENNSNSDDCSCDLPDSFFFKLNIPSGSEEVLFFNVQRVALQTAIISDLHVIFEFKKPVEYTQAYHSPPPNLRSSHEFLILIHQLKIPSFA